MSIYEYLKGMSNFESKIVLVIEYNEPIKEMFDAYVVHKYPKTYKTSQKQTFHCIIKN